MSETRVREFTNSIPAELVSLAETEIREMFSIPTDATGAGMPVVAARADWKEGGHLEALSMACYKVGSSEPYTMYIIVYTKYTPKGYRYVDCEWIPLPHTELDCHYIRISNCHFFC